MRLKVAIVAVFVALVSSALYNLPPQEVFNAKRVVRQTTVAEDYPSSRLTFLKQGTKGNCTARAYTRARLMSPALSPRVMACHLKTGADHAFTVYTWRGKPWVLDDTGAPRQLWAYPCQSQPIVLWS